MSTRSQTLTRGDRYELRWYQNEVFTLRCTLQDEEGDVIDLTGKTVTLSAVESPYDASAAWSLTGSLVDSGTTGMVDFAVTTTQSALVRDYSVTLKYTSSGADDTHLVLTIRVLRDYA